MENKIMKLGNEGIFYLILLVALIGIFTGGAIELIGSYPENVDEAFTWSAPLMMLFLMLTPALLGFEIGRKVEQ